MRAVLEFQLPEEQEAFDMAVRSSAYYLALLDLSNFLRQKVKYSNLTNDERKAYEAIRAEFFAILSDNDIGDIP
jgi:hypothetical protein